MGGDIVGYATANLRDAGYNQISVQEDILIAVRVEMNSVDMGTYNFTLTNGNSLVGPVTLFPSDPIVVTLGVTEYNISPIQGTNYFYIAQLF